MHTVQRPREGADKLSLLRTIELSVTTGMFIWVGFIEALTEAQKNGFDGELPTGQVELAREISTAITLLDYYTCQMLEEAPGPGVWEYDVAEPLGAWLFEQLRSVGRLPPSKDIVDEGCRRTAEFIQEWRRDESNVD